MSLPPPHPWTDNELIGRGISFRGFALPVSDHPFIIEEGQADLVRRSVEAACAAAERIVDAFPRDPSLRRLFGYDAFQESFILKDPGYRPLIPLGRWDSFLFPGGPRFMEYNTDGTAGWHYSAALTKLWRERHGMPQEDYPLTARLLDTLLACFRQWDRRGIERPRIAIVDWAEVGTRSEQEALAAFFTASGYPATVEDPRALRLAEGSLMGPSGEVNLVYRRVVSEEAFRRAEEIRPFLDGYLENAACFVGSFRTDPAWSKALFVALSDPAFARILPPPLASELASCIPWTRLLRPGPVDHGGEARDMEDLLLSNPGEFVLKPVRGYEGRGVVVGPLVPLDTWKEAVREGISHGGFLVQEMLRPEPVALQGGPPRYVQPGLYVLLGRLAGFLARTSATPLISPEYPERYCPIGAEIPWAAEEGARGAGEP